MDVDRRREPNGLKKHVGEVLEYFYCKEEWSLEKDYKEVALHGRENDCLKMVREGKVA